MASIGSETSVLDGLAWEDFSRREFIKRGLAGAVTAGAALAAAGEVATATHAFAAPRHANAALVSGLVEAGPELALPPGFRYTTFGAFGSAMSDGYITPPIPDGMGVFPVGGGRVRIVRNHEIGDSNDVRGGSVLGDPATAYDPKAPGGTTTMIVEGGKLIESFLSLNGTDSNCAGAPTPWGTWLTCEETTVGPSGPLTKKHGYVFEVDAYADKPMKRSPIKGMGRMLHEAAGVDKKTGVAYLTEDEGPDGFYRFVPNEFGNYRAGGVLQALKVRGAPNYNTVAGHTRGDVLPCKWVTIPNPDPANAEDDASAVRKQADARGAAKFKYGEGCTMVGKSCVFDNSEGGAAHLGQIWQYTPTKRRGKLDETGELELLYESPGRARLDSPDNLATSPSGAVVIAEDGNLKSNLVRALLPDGSIFPIAQNLVPVQLQLLDVSGKLYEPRTPDDDYAAGDGVGYSEFAGPRFSPNGKWLFVNIQVPGITCAITGDWGSLGL